MTTRQPVPAVAAVLAVLTDRIDDVPASALQFMAEDIADAVRPPIAAELADDVDGLPRELGDAGWAALEQRAVNAGWPASSLRRLRSREDSFSTITVEAAYQHGYREAAKLLRKIEGGQTGA